MDLAVAPVELHRLLEHDTGQGRSQRGDLREIRLGQAEVVLELGPLGGRERRSKIGLQLGDLGGHLPDVILDALEPLLQHGLTRDLIGHDLRVRIGLRVDFVAVPVVPVEMRVHDVPHGLRGDLPQPLHDRASGRRLSACRPRSRRRRSR